MAVDQVTVRWVSLDGCLYELTVPADVIGNGLLHSGYWGEPKRYSPGDAIALLEAEAQRLRVKLEDLLEQYPGLASD
jgi:hypothetical protein